VCEWQFILFVAMIIIISIILLIKVSRERFQNFVHLHSSLVRVFTFRGHSRLVGV